METVKTSQIPFLNLFLAAAKSPNAPQIIAVAQLLIFHVRIYVVTPVVRTTIVKNELTLMRSSVMMIKKQMAPVVVVNTNCLNMMK